MSDHVTKSIKARREKRERAHLRVRQRVRGSAARPRLSVYKSLKFIYAQVIDDDKGVTLVAATSADAAVRDAVKGSTSSKAAAKLVGELVAERAKAAGIEAAVFDRGGYQYHGRVKAFAEGVREGGLTV